MEQMFLGNLNITRYTTLKTEQCISLPSKSRRTPYSLKYQPIRGNINLRREILKKLHRSRWRCYDFKQLISGVQSPGQWSVVQWQITIRSGIEIFIAHMSWRKYMACCERPQGKVKVKSQCWQWERQELGHMPLLAYADGVL